MALLIVALLVLSLAANIFPMFNVVAILCLVPLRLFWTKAATPDRRLGPRTAINFLLAAYAFWIFSYLLTTARLSNLLSYNFLRYEGALLVGYLPLLLLGDAGIRPTFVYRIIWVYLGVLAGAAAVGAALMLFLEVRGRNLMASPLLHGFLSFQSYHEMPIMLLGLYRTHMTAGTQYAMAALLTLCFMLRDKTPKIVFWSGLFFVSLLAALILSGARTAYVAFVATLIIQFASQKKYFRPLLKIGTLVLVPAMVFILSQPNIFNRAATIINFEGQDNVEGRFRLYQTALDNFSDSPLIGIGFGRYSDVGKTFLGIRHVIYIAISGGSKTDIDQVNEVHDSYLQFLAEGGVVGLFLMLGVWIATYRWAGRLRHKFKDGTRAAALCEGVQASVMATFFSSLTGTSMMMATTPLFVFTMVGLLRNVVAWESRLQIVGSEISDSSIVRSSGVHKLGLQPSQ